MIKNEYPDSELTGKIIGCSMEVHKTLGNGFQEVIYQRALAIEFKKQGSASAGSTRCLFFTKLNL